MTTDPTALLRRTEAYLSALHGSVARHDQLAANLACAGCELRDEIRAALAVLPESTDRAAVLREAADAVFALDYDALVGEEGDENLGSMREAWDLGTIHATELLRRLAAEAPTTTKPEETGTARVILLRAADELDRYVGKQSNDAAPEVEGARLVIRELRRIAERPQPAAEPGTCGHRSSEGHPCGQPSGHLGYHRNVRQDGDEWTSWVGEPPRG